MRGVGGATGVIRRSLAGASCARSTSRAALLASTPTCAGGRAASTRASARNRSRDSDGSARRCGRYVESAGAGCEAGLAGRCVRAWRVCDRWAKRRFRSVSATSVARTAVLTREWSSSVCACEASVNKVGMRNHESHLITKLTPSVAVRIVLARGILCQDAQRKVARLLEWLG